MSRWMYIEGEIEFENLCLNEADLDAWIQSAPLPRGSEGDLTWYSFPHDERWPDLLPKIVVDASLRDHGWAEDIEGVEKWFRALDFSGVIQGYVEISTLGMFVEGLYFVRGQGVQRICVPSSYFPSRQEGAGQPDEPVEYGGLSCWIEEDDPPTARQLVGGLARAALLWGGTPSGCKGSLRFYAGQMRRYKKLLLERLGVDSSK